MAGEEIYKDSWTRIPIRQEEDCKQVPADNICRGGTYTRHSIAIMDASSRIMKGAYNA
jgi:hypothetical protein